MFELRGKLGEPIARFPSKFTQRPDEPPFLIWYIVHWSKKTCSFISPSATLFEVCLKKKKEANHLLKGIWMETRSFCWLSQKGVTNEALLCVLKQTNKQKNKCSAVRLCLWGWIVYHPGGFLAKWICQLSVFVLKETFAESKHLHCEGYPEVTSHHLDKAYATMQLYQHKTESAGIFVCVTHLRQNFSFTSWNENFANKTGEINCSQYTRNSWKVAFKQTRMFLSFSPLWHWLRWALCIKPFAPHHNCSTQ